MSGSRSLSTEGLLYLGLHAIGKVEEGQVTTDQLISQTFKEGGGAYDMLEGVDVQFILFHKCRGNLMIIHNHTHIDTVVY